MRRWIYALTGAFIILALFTIAAVVALGGEIAALRRQMRTGSSLEALVPPAATLPPLAGPTNKPNTDTSLTILGSARNGSVISLLVRVQTAMPVALFSTSPILADATGKGYTASKDSLDKASIAALDLGQHGYVDIGLDFPVSGGFTPAVLIFNTGSSSAIAPVLKVSLSPGN